jgi:TolB protein
MDSYAFAHSSPIWIGEVGSVDRASELRSVAVLRAALAGARVSLMEGYEGAEIPILTARFDAAEAALDAREGGGPLP